MLGTAGGDRFVSSDEVVWDGTNEGVVRERRKMREKLRLTVVW